MWSQIVPLAVLSIVLAGCGRPPAPDYTANIPINYRPPPAEDELRAQAAVWSQCVISKVRELDDGRSDAATIAVPVQDACSPFYLPRDKGDASIIIGAILKMRSNARSQPGASPIVVTPPVPMPPGDRRF